MVIGEILGRLEGVKPSGKNQWMAKCPAHADTKPSLAIGVGDTGTVLLYCHGGCTYQDVMAAIGNPTQLNPTTKPNNKRIVATYDYQDKDGTILYRVIRYDPKGFSQARPNGAGGWVKGLGNQPRVIYRWPEVAMAQGIVWIVEGEKDVETLRALGEVATTNSGGAEKWTVAMSEAVRGLDLIILPDSDECGQRHATMVASMTVGRAKRVRIATVPRAKKDISEWAQEEASPDLGPIIAAARDVSTDIVDIVVESTNPDDLAARYAAMAPPYHWHERDGWSMWMNDQWQEIQAKGQLAVYVGRFLSKCKVLQPSGLKKVPTTSYSVDELIYNLANREEIYLQPNRQGAPCSLDGTLDPANVVACRNGLYDWIADHLYPPSKAFYTRNYMPYDWGNKECPRWLEYLRQATDNNKTLIDLLQTWAGYIFIPGQPYQCCCLIYGPAATGKSLFAQVLTEMIGMSNVSMIPLNHFDRLDMLTATYGKLLNVGEENEARLADGLETMIKQYLAGGPLTFRRLYGAPFTQMPSAKLLFVTNHLPNFKDTSAGIWRRLVLIPFRCVIPSEAQDPYLLDKLRDEMPGILSWALEGARRLRRLQRFPVPDEVLDLRASYRLKTMPEREFIASCVVPSAIGTIDVTELKLRYEAWCEAERIKPAGTRRLFEALEEMHAGAKFIRVRSKRNSNHYAGVRLSVDADGEELPI